MIVLDDYLLSFNDIISNKNGIDFLEVKDTTSDINYYDFFSADFYTEIIKTDPTDIVFKNVEIKFDDIGLIFLTKNNKKTYDFTQIVNKDKDNKIVINNDDFTDDNSKTIDDTYYDYYKRYKYLNEINFNLQNPIDSKNDFDSNKLIEIKKLFNLIYLKKDEIKFNEYVSYLKNYYIIKLLKISNYIKNILITYYYNYFITIFTNLINNDSKGSNSKLEKAFINILNSYSYLHSKSKISSSLSTENNNYNTIINIFSKLYGRNTTNIIINLKKKDSSTESELNSLILNVEINKNLAPSDTIPLQTENNLFIMQTYFMELKEKKQTTNEEDYNKIINLLEELLELLKKENISKMQELITIIETIIEINKRYKTLLKSKQLEKIELYVESINDNIGVNILAADENKNKKSMKSIDEINKIIISQKRLSNINHKELNNIPNNNLFIYLTILILICVCLFLVFIDNNLKKLKIPYSIIILIFLLLYYIIYSNYESKNENFSEDIKNEYEHVNSKLDEIVDKIYTTIKNNNKKKLNKNDQDIKIKNALKNESIRYTNYNKIYKKHIINIKTQINDKYLNYIQNKELTKFLILLIVIIVVIYIANLNFKDPKISVVIGFLLFIPIYLVYLYNINLINKTKYTTKYWNYEYKLN